MLIDQKYCLFNTNILAGELTPLWEENREFLDLFLQVNKLSLLSPYRLFQIYQYSKFANNIEGDFAQVGIYRGGSAKFISLVLSSDKKLHLFDTFNGLPTTDPLHDLFPQGRFNDTSEKEVQNLLKSLNKNITITKGIFPASALEEHKKLKYSFVYLDVDIYSSNLNALKFFYPKLSTDGVILIDDYEWKNTPGIKESVDDFINEYKLPSPIITTKYQCMIRKIS